MTGGGDTSIRLSLLTPCTSHQSLNPHTLYQTCSAAERSSSAGSLQTPPEEPPAWDSRWLYWRHWTRGISPRCGTCWRLPVSKVNKRIVTDHFSFLTENIRKNVEQHSRVVTCSKEVATQWWVEMLDLRSLYWWYPVSGHTGQSVAGPSLPPHHPAGSESLPAAELSATLWCLAS